MSYPNEIFIFFEYNGREISGIDQFKKALDKSYLAQGKDYSLPAYSEGGEAWFTVFINSEFFEFAKAMTLGGLAWDLLKFGARKFFLKPLFNALEELWKENEKTHRLRILKMKFQFDDIEIIMGGVEPPRLAAVSLVFDEIVKRRKRIEIEIQTSIDTIETPIFFNPSVDKKGYSPYNLETRPDNLESYLGLWKIWYMGGHRSCTIYDLKKDEFKESHPNK
jgi:hypothetical protein